MADKMTVAEAKKRLDAVGWRLQPDFPSLSARGEPTGKWFVEADLRRGELSIQFLLWADSRSDALGDLVERVEKMEAAK